MPTGNGERRVLDGAAHAFSHLLCGKRLGIRHHHDKFLATKARDDVDATHRLAEAFGAFAQHFVADIMAVLVVDGLEVVNVQHQQRHRRAAGGIVVEQA